VRRPYRGHHAVLRQLHFAALQPLLQRGLGVFGSGLHLGVDLHPLKQATHQASAAKTGIQVHGANQASRASARMEGRCCPPERASPSPRRNTSGHLQAQCQLVQRVLLDQVGAHTRQIALGQGAQPLVQQTGHRQIEHRIAQKLQAFIVVGRKTAVREARCSKS
jgi:hypothetical protein